MRVKNITNQAIPLGAAKLDIVKKIKHKSQQPKKKVKKIDPSIRAANKQHRKKIKKVKKMIAIRSLINVELERLVSEHNCIRRQKKCYSREGADDYIRNSGKKLYRYYCKKCSCYHLTSSEQHDL